MQFPDRRLVFWENEFKYSLDKHIDFLNKNLENQDIYNAKFSQLLQDMEIFDTGDDENQENDQNVIF